MNWLKALEIKISMLFNLSFPNKTILSWFFSFFLIYFRNDFYFLIPTVIVQICNPTAEPIISIDTPSKEPKASVTLATNNKKN